MLSFPDRFCRISLFNLMLVAFFGVILRFKIAWALPFIDQKYFLHAHSHFAFAGWISQALMTLLVAYLANKNSDVQLKKYKLIFYLNLATAYGMLLSFAIQGYAFFSILFSTLSIFVSYAFIVCYWRDLSRLKTKSICHYWFKSALIFNAISSAGPFALAYMMATKHVVQNWYLVSVYFFLHFQYNGWFFFACMGLLCAQLSRYGIPDSKLKKVFWLFSIACIPVFFLSALWLPIPGWIYLVVIIAAFCQLAGWGMLIQLIAKQKTPILANTSKVSRWLFLLSAIALTIKLLLQTGSVIPSLSKLAFGFRPIVIGYLHLVLLGVISIFIIAYMLSFKFISATRISITGILIFVFGILLNEILLMIHGIADLNYIGVPFITVLLFVAALVLFTGTILINYVQIQKDAFNHN